MRAAVFVLHALLCASIALAVAASAGCASCPRTTEVRYADGPDDDLRAMVEACDHLPAHVTLREHTPVRVRGTTVWCAR